MKYFTFFVFTICSLNMFCQEWQTSYSEALSCAKDQNKPIILVFSGSDWCAPCIRLDKEIWQSTEFKSYAKENYILYKADFPRKKSNKLDQRLETQNKALAESFNPKRTFSFGCDPKQRRKRVRANGIQEDYTDRIRFTFKFFS